MLQKFRHLVLEGLLWAASLAGLIAIILVICAHLFSVSLILFRTGSMDPTIPQGSAAVVREVPAAEVNVGDVVTVERPGQLPVTHRVTSVSPGERPAERVITMQGDANDSEDPYPYTVTEVREVMWSVPGLAHPLHRMRDPWVMGAITVSAALLVGWAFWPRGHKSRAAPDSEGSDDGTAQRPRHATVTHSMSGVLAVPTLILSGGLMMAAPGEAVASPLQEEPATEVIQGEYLRLTSVRWQESSMNLVPGHNVVWEVGIGADAPEPGEVRTGLSSTGEAPLRVQVESCAVRWAEHAGGGGETSCPQGYELLRQEEEVTQDGTVDWLDTHSSETDRWLRLTVSLSEDAGIEDRGLISTMRVHAVGQGEELSTAPPPDPGQSGNGYDDPGVQEDSLARTGAPLLSLLLVALICLLLGQGLLRVRKHGTSSEPGREAVR